MLIRDDLGAGGVAAPKGEYRWLKVLEEDARWASGTAADREFVFQNYVGESFCGHNMGILDSKLYFGVSSWTEVGTMNRLRTLDISNSTTGALGEACRTVQESAAATDWGNVPSHCRPVEVSPYVKTPEARKNHGQAVTMNHLYVFGGADDDSNELTSLWKIPLTGQTAQWSSVSPTALAGTPGPRRHHLMVLWEHLVLVFGGCTRVRRL